MPPRNRFEIANTGEALELILNHIEVREPLEFSDVEHGVVVTVGVPRARYEDIEHARPVTHEDIVYT